MMRLYVGHLSFDTTEDELRAAFEQFGTITDAMIVKDRQTDRSRGFAFVTFSTDKEGEAAINGLHGKNLHGRNLTVNEARPRDNRENRGGGGGGGGGYRPRRSGGGGGGARGGRRYGSSGGHYRGERSGDSHSSSSSESDYSESQYQSPS